ncbi:MAG: hypothetical protein KAI43_04260 [Candidatus Aureabacteria bacterium]|nr:hypothetical protein [Candidatus Auribacterota bacterium]
MKRMITVFLAVLFIVCAVTVFAGEENWTSTDILDSDGKIAEKHYTDEEEIVAKKEYFDKNGVKAMDEEFRSDGLLLNKNLYDENGKLEYHEIFVDGKLYSKEDYDKDGNSTIIFYHTDTGGVRSTHKEFVDGNVMTRKIYNSKGDLVEEEIFVDDCLTKSTYFDRDGNTRSTEEHKGKGKNFHVTKRTAFRSDGSKYSVTHYDENRNTINTDYYDKDGNLSPTPVYGGDKKDDVPDDIPVDPEHSVVPYIQPYYGEKKKSTTTSSNIFFYGPDFDDTVCDVASGSTWLKWETIGTCVDENGDGYVGDACSQRFFVDTGVCTQGEGESICRQVPAPYLDDVIGECQYSSEFEYLNCGTACSDDGGDNWYVGCDGLTNLPGVAGVCDDLQSPFPESDPATGFRWSNISPRISMTYDITGDGKNVVKVSYARYYPKPSIPAGGLPDWANKSGAVGLGFDPSLGGINGLSVRTYVSPLFGIDAVLGFRITSNTDPDMYTVDVENLFEDCLGGTCGVVPVVVAEPVVTEPVVDTNDTPVATCPGCGKPVDECTCG